MRIFTIAKKRATCHKALCTNVAKFMDILLMQIIARIGDLFHNYGNYSMFNYLYVYKVGVNVFPVTVDLT